MNAPDTALIAVERPGPILVDGSVEVRPIPGWEGIYSVSADGRVWSHPRKWASGRHGKTLRSNPGRWMRASIATHGYYMLFLSRDGTQKNHYVHILLARAWIPNPLSLPEVNHLNGIKSDTCIGNLEWSTSSDNRKHAFRLGLIPRTAAWLAAVQRNIKIAKAAQMQNARARREASCNR